MIRPPRMIYSLLVLLCLIANTWADWTRFRGPNGSGVSLESGTAPVRWDATANLKWKVALPGPGSSSPIIVGDRVFVTCWSGYGMDRDNPEDPTNLRRHLVCVNRENGEIIWDRAVEPVLPEDEYGGMFAEHGFASHTPVSDGERVYVYFGKSGALAFDLDGNQLWQTIIGSELDPHGWGSASSPILYKDLLIITASAESEALVGLDKRTGKEIWRQEASGLNGLWGTPILVEVDSGRTDLVIGVPSEIWGINPDTGKLRWYCTSVENNTSCASVVAGTDKMVYAMEGRGGGSVAVRAGGSGDVTDSHVLWTGRSMNRIGTPAFYDGRLYFFNGGIAHCVDASSGESVFQGRLKGLPQLEQDADGRRARGSGRGFGGDYSSAVIADGKVYFVTRGGDMFVLEAGDQFAQLAVNRVNNQGEDFSATPAVSHGQLFIRSDKFLYCIAPMGQTPQTSDPLPEDNTIADQEKIDRPGGDRERGRGRTDGGPGGRPAEGRFDPDAIFRERDTDHDGKLTGDEISQRLRENLEQVDADKDGAVTAQEFRQGLQRMFAANRGGPPDARRGRPKRQKRPPWEDQ